MEKARYEHALNIVYSGRVEDKRKEEELERRKYARRGEEGFEEVEDSEVGRENSQAKWRSMDLKADATRRTAD